MAMEGKTLQQLAQLRQRDRAKHAPVYSNLMTAGVGLYCDVTSRNLSKWAFFERVGNFECKFLTEEGTAYQPLLVSGN